MFNVKFLCYTYNNNMNITLQNKQIILYLLYEEAKVTNMQIINHIFYYNNELKNN